MFAGSTYFNSCLPLKEKGRDNNFKDFPPIRESLIPFPYILQRTSQSKKNPPEMQSFMSALSEENDE